MFVSDRALCFFESDNFLNIVRIYKDETYPIIVPKIEHLSKNHWQKMLLNSFEALKQILKDIDSVAYSRSLKIETKQNNLLQFSREELDLKWSILNQNIKK